MYAILIYDISMEGRGQWVLSKVYKNCKKYMVHIQNSVFEGEISEGQMCKLRKDLSRYLRRDIDSCIIFKSRSEKWLEKEFWTISDDKTTNFI